MDRLRIGESGTYGVVFVECFGVEEEEGGRFLGEGEVGGCCLGLDGATLYEVEGEFFFVFCVLYYYIIYFCFVIENISFHHDLLGNL